MAGFVSVKPLRACLVVATGAGLLLSAAVATAQEGPEEPAEERPLPERVLFIGNSHTERFGGLDTTIENFVASEDPPRRFDGEILTEGGVTLEYHWDNGAKKSIRVGDYDTVVLQGYLPGAKTRNAEPFLEHARLLDEVIGATGAETVFFMTWPRGFNDWSDYDDVAEAHRIVEAELGARVAPAALAFELAQTERPEVELMNPDRIHATWEGAYLAAATVYATLFDRSPEGLPYDFGITDTGVAPFLQRIAWQAVTEWRQGTTATDEEAPPEGD